MNQLFKLTLLITSYLLGFNIAGTAQNNTELSHNAPTLQIGLDRLNFAKGTLDAELIMQIVAEKQQEVGLKLVQNMFLSKVEHAGGAFYSFTDNIIRGVVSERDINVIAKRLLENTVNITFTYAFADYYIKTAEKADLAAINVLAKCKEINVTKTDFSSDELQAGLKSFKSKGEKELSDSSVQINPKVTKLIALMADMSSEIIRNNSVLKELGIMQVSYAQSYEYMNEYRSMERSSSADFKHAQAVYILMEAKLSQYTNVIGLLHYGLQANSYRLNVNNVLKTMGTTNVTSLAGIRGNLTTINSNLKAMTTNMQALMVTSSDSVRFNRLYKAVDELQKIKIYTTKAESFFSGISSMPETTELQKLGITSDIVYTLYADIIPKLRSSGIWDSRGDENVKAVEDICKFIYDKYVNDQINILNKRGSSVNIEKFLSILSMAYQFDRANTFANSVKLLSDLETVFPNERIKDALVFINTYVRDFVAIYTDSNGKEYIGVNLESLISKLSTVRSDELKRGSILFNVGVNTTYYPNGLKLEDGTNISNFSFVSEKIGFKYKLKDRSFWKTRNPGETYTISNTQYKKIATPSEPVVSNIHGIVYGSGILYNIFNTGTTKDFNSPMIGVGFGLSFFNSLDFNLTTGFPILRKGGSSKSQFIGFGFDFPFTEYIKRLSEKNRDRKNKELIAEAVSGTRI